MPDDGYAYDIDQCDVPIERRNTLRRFRERRRLWLSWLHTDRIHPIWPTLHTMVWTEVAFGTLTALAVDSGENALNNPLLAEALLTGHVATQVLAIRRLMEDSPKERLSLRSLVKDLNRHAGLFTRENYVCFDGLPYDYGAVRDAWFIENAGKRGQGSLRAPRQYAAESESLHMIFDKLAGIHPAKRSREDRLPRDLQGRHGSARRAGKKSVANTAAKRGGFSTDRLAFCGEGQRYRPDTLSGGPRPREVMSYRPEPRPVPGRQAPVRLLP
jgi:hypothetical protein